MDNFTLMLVGSGLATSGAISFRGSSVLAVRALAAGALAPGVIMLYVAVVNALSGT